MNADGKRIYSFLKTIAFTRAAGSDQEKRAAWILADEIRAMGFEVKLEEFAIHTDEATAQMKVLEPYEKTYCVDGVGFAKPTPAGGITAAFLYADDYRKGVVDVKDKLCLFGEMSSKEKQLAEDGIAGILHVRGNAARMDDPATPTGSYSKQEMRGKITALEIAARDAMELVDRGALKVWFTLQGEQKQSTSQNVVVTLPGTERTDEIIVVGAHYDSVGVGDGACDNGGASAIVMELLRCFAADPPKRTFRFVWFGAEEIGLEGSKAYLRAHKEELNCCRLMINVDVAGATVGRNFVRATGEESIAHYIEFMAKESGYVADIKQGLMGSDSTPFAGRKIPAVGFGRRPARYAEICHSEEDTLRYISPDALEQTAQFVLQFARRMDEAKEFPIPQTIPENVAKRISEMLEEE